MSSRRRSRRQRDEPGRWSRERSGLEDQRPNVVHVVIGDDDAVRGGVDALCAATGGLVLALGPGGTVATTGLTAEERQRAGDVLPSPPFDSGSAHRSDAEIDESLALLLVRHQADVVHVHGLAPGLTGARAIEIAYHLGVPTVLTLHDEPVLAADPLRDAAWLNALWLADLVTRAHQSVYDGLDRPAWLPEDTPVLGVRGGQAVTRWAEVYSALAGDLGAVPGTAMLSVVVSTYERNDVLRECLESLTRSTLPRERFEVLVVDDCSPTPAAPVAQEFRGRLTLRYIRRTENGGPGEARNTGIREATGEVVLLLDDDDVVQRRCLGEHLRRHVEDEDPWLAVLGFTGLTPALLADPVMHSLTVESQLYFGYPGLRDGQVLPWWYLWNGRISLKRQALLREPFETDFVEDTDLGLRLRDRSRIVYARSASQAVARALDSRAFLVRSSKIGAATYRVARRHDHPEEGVLAPPGAEALRWMERAVPAALEVIRRLEGRGLTALRGTVWSPQQFDAPREELVLLAALGQELLPLRGERRRGPAWQVTQAYLLDVALAVAGTHERLAGYCVARRLAMTSGRRTVLALPDWDDPASIERAVVPFARALGEHDAVTLRLGVSGRRAEDALGAAVAVLDRAGLDLEALPDIELVTYDDAPPSADFWVAAGRATRPEECAPLPVVEVEDALRRLLGVAGGRTRALR